ncbi:MAG: ATP phosphoribosyltransferase [Deinococcales bacterium]
MSKGAKPVNKLTIALPKGRVMEESLAGLNRAGLELKLSTDSRALKHDNPDGLILEMRNGDVPTYVDLGIADLGIVGKDVLLESGLRLYEPVDLGFARCRMSLIRPQGKTGPIERIASKYPRVSHDYFKKQGLTVEVIKLSGNVELACLTGLADAVVDIVQTGSTLKANHLEEVEVIFESSARLIVNRAALKLKTAELRPLIKRLRELVH